MPEGADAVLMVEYAEMTAFNFNSKEYQEVKKDFVECKDMANGFDNFMKNFVSKFVRAEAI